MLTLYVFKCFVIGRKIVIFIKEIFKTFKTMLKFKNIRHNVKNRCFAFLKQDMFLNIEVLFRKY